MTQNVQNESNGPKWNIKMNENGWKSPKMSENELKMTKIERTSSLRNDANGPKWILKVNENGSKSLKMIQN